MQLRLATLNVWGLPKPFSDDLSARLRAMATKLPDLPVDVLLVQEAWSDEMRDGLQAAAQAAGFYTALASRTSGGGLMAISRLPILSNRFEKFRFRGDPERLSQGEFLGAKGFQTLAIETDAGPTTVINTHLHARYRRARPRLNSAVRAAQLLQLVGEVHRTPGTLLIGGDLNCSSTDPEYRIWKGLTGAVEAAEGRRDLSTLSRSNYYKRHRSGADKRVDYLFIRPGRGVRPRFESPSLLFAERTRIRGIERSFSDHFGFQAQAHWEPAEARAAAPPPPAAQPLDPEAFALAKGLLDVGNEEADRREAAHFRYATSWVAGAALAASLRKDPWLTRRRFLKSMTGVVAFASLAPAAGYGTLARVDSDSKRGAFDDARAVLAQLERASLQTT